MLSSLRLEKHPDKTFIGRIERGFDFLGFGPEGLSVARKTLGNFAERALRLYEQEPTRLGEYVERWLRWTGTNGDGLATGATCESFTSANPALVGVEVRRCVTCGTVGAVVPSPISPHTWTDKGVPLPFSTVTDFRTCSNGHHLYCFQNQTDLDRRRRMVVK